MKRLWIAAGLIVFAAGLCASGYAMMNSSARKLKRILDEGIEAAGRDDYFAAADAAESAKQQWSKTKHLLEVFVDHADVRELDDYLVTIVETAENGDIEDFGELCTWSSELLTEIIENEIPKVHTVLNVVK